MIKVVRIISRLNIGGPAIHTILLSSSLNRDGYKDILVCGRSAESEGDMLSLARDKKVEPILVPELQREISLIDDIRSLFALLRIMKKERPDIVHTHTAKAGALGRLAAFLAGVPVQIHTFHGHIFDGYFSPIKAKLFLLIERFLALFTDKIITVSETVKCEIVDKLKVTSQAKSAVIPLGLDLQKFLNCEKRKGAFRRELGLDKSVLLVGIVGRLVPIKNHKMFLDAAKIILSRTGTGQVKFLIIGDGEFNNFLRSYAKEIGIEGKATFLGWKDNLDAVYADLDVVALTSLNEGTPVSLIEAMAAGKAVIATDVGGMRDLIIDNENGILSKANDIDDFSDKLYALLNDREKRLALGERGREYVRNKYNIERLVSDIKNLYDECLSLNAQKIRGRHRG